MEDKHMAVHVDGNPGGFAEVNARRKPRPALDLLVPDGCRGSEWQTIQTDARRGDQPDGCCEAKACQPRPIR